MVAFENSVIDTLIIRFPVQKINNTFYHLILKSKVVGTKICIYNILLKIKYDMKI